MIAAAKYVRDASFTFEYTIASWDLAYLLQLGQAEGGGQDADVLAEEADAETGLPSIACGGMGIHSGNPQVIHA